MRTGPFGASLVVGAALAAAIFTVGEVFSAERTVLGEYITADW